MKYKSCDKCGEIVTKTGFISSSPTLKESGCFAKCNNIKCAKYFSEPQYEKLSDKELQKLSEKAGEEIGKVKGCGMGVERRG